MTVASNNKRKDYVGNGILLIYAYDFLIFDEDHLEVYVDGAIQTVNVDYTVSGVGNPVGGNVTFTVAPGLNIPIAILRVVPLTQLVNYVAHDAFPAETHEGALDRLVMITQQLEETLNRTIHLPTTSQGSGLLPTDGIANYFVKVDATGLGFELEAVVPGGTDLTPYAMLAGRAGGQHLRGGNNADENLILESTSNAVKGGVITLDILYGGLGAGDNLRFESTRNAVKGDVRFNDQTLRFNSDYAVGDEDVTLNFNDGMALLVFEYLNAVHNVRQFTLNERFYTEKTFNTGASDFDAGGLTWVHKVAAEYDYAAWALGYKAGVGYFASIGNKLNDLVPEIAGFDAFMYAVTANSRAGMIGCDTNMIKNNPCVTSNGFMGNAANLCSDVDPTQDAHGAGYIAGAFATLAGYAGGVRQYTAFMGRGDVGWKYFSRFIDTDGAGILYSVDQYGAMIFRKQMTMSALASKTNRRTDRGFSYLNAIAVATKVLDVEFPAGQYYGAYIEIEVGGLQAGVGAGLGKKRWWARVDNAVLTLTAIDEFTDGSAPVFTSNVAGMHAEFLVNKAGGAASLTGTVYVKVTVLNNDDSGTVITYS